MPLQENVATRLAYKIHTATSMTPNTQLVSSSDPGASGGQELRRVTSTLKLVKDTYQSAEIRTSRQVSDMRHGKRMIQGEITGELSPVTYFPLIEAAFRATKVATFSRSNAEFTSCAADTSTSKFTVAASTWAAQGFRVGDVLNFTNMSNAANNAVNFIIYSLSGVDAFVYPAPTTQSADTAFSVARVGTKISVPLTSHVKRLWAFEHFHADSDVTQLFTECRVTGVKLSMPATGLNTISIAVSGRDQTILTGGSSPFFTAPTAIGSDGLTAAVNGVIFHQGVRVGVITGIDIDLSMAADAPAVAGQNFVPEIFLGRTVVTGQATLLFQDETFLNAFSNETEVEILLMLTTTSAANSPFLAITLPRVKFQGADLALQGEGGLPISLPFQALEKPATTGYDATTIVMIDSAAT